MRSNWTSSEFYRLVKGLRRYVGVYEMTFKVRGWWFIVSYQS